MTWKKFFPVLGTLTALLSAPPARAANNDPATTINDIYAWMSADGSGKVYLVMTVYPAAPTSARFSTAAAYVFHTTSRLRYVTSMVAATPTDIICTFSFDAVQKVSCWAGRDPDGYVVGDTASPTGVAGASGKIRVFAGLRKDHSFFNLGGFNRVAGLIKDRYTNNLMTLNLDGAGCPRLDATTQMQWSTGLRQDQDGKDPAVDASAKLNTLAIILELDKSLVARGGDIVSVWGGAHLIGK